MIELRIRNRSRLRRKEIVELAARLQDEFGCPTIFTEDDPLETGEQDLHHVLLLGKDIIGIRHEGQIGLSIRGLLRYGATKRYVTVDMGAVKFVTNGADVMGPGIVDADPAIRSGQLVWVREERHGKPLAVGVAQADGDALRTKPKGKQVKNLHFVGDRLWLWGQEDATPT